MALQLSRQFSTEVMTVSRKGHGQGSLSGREADDFCEVRVKCRLSTSKTNSKAIQRVEFKQPAF